MSFLPEVPPEQMTMRARWYLIAVAAYCLVMAFGLWVLPEWFATKNFRKVIDMLPFQLYGWAFLHTFVGSLSFYAAWRGSGSAAYKALIAAAMVVGVWAFGFVLAVVIAFQANTTASWSAAVAYTFITAIHLIQARQPIRSPFDPVIRQLHES